MWIQVVFLFFPVIAAANCFDFSAKIEKPLREDLPLVEKQDNSTKGLRDSDMTWAQVRGVVDKPIGGLYSKLLDHDSTKSPRVDEMEVEKLEKPGYLAFHLVKFLIKPFLFVKIRWTEEWAYALTEGTPEQQRKVVISYQKSEGTSHIEHLCGNIVLRKLGDNATDVFLYEEAKATQRSPEDTLDGLVGTLKTLRK